MGDLKLPEIDYGALAPMLILFGVACVGVLLEVFIPRKSRNVVQLTMTLLGVAAALTVLIINRNTRIVTIGGAVAFDGPTIFLQGAILVLGGVSLLLIGERSVEAGGAFVAQAAVVVGSDKDSKQSTGQPGLTEVYPLAAFALGGMLLFVAANDLLTMFVALEVFSLPLYLLCALARRRRLLSQEAALKYFLLGSYASAFFLFGVALLYGYSGGVQLSVIHAAVDNPQHSQLLLYGGLGLVAIGLLFKSALAPFHVWTPDVYQGAPTPITAFMAACTKVAAFGALLRVLYVAFEGVRWDFQPVLGTVAVLTMFVGAVLAVTQTDMKRLLAYSSIANAGYLMVGVLALNDAGLESTMLYLVAYGFSVLAAFAIVSLVRDSEGEATHLSRWAGIGRKSPLLAGVFTLILLAFAGIPLTSGFTAKFAVFGAAYEGGQIWLVVFGVISSMLIAFPYLRVVVLMWQSEPSESTPAVSIPGFLTAAALGIGVLVTIGLGVYPSPLIDLTREASHFVR